MEKELIVPDVPLELRTPATVRERPVENLGDIGLIVTDLVEANDANSGKIEVTDCILRKAEALVARKTEPECDDTLPKAKTPVQLSQTPLT